jgi:hypothetical protein
VVRREAASRRDGRLKVGKREAGSTTKPSRSNEARAALQGSVGPGVDVGVPSVDMLGGFVRVVVCVIVAIVRV